MAKVSQKVNYLEIALNLVGKKYGLLIIDSISSNKNKRRFNQILKDIPSSNPRIVSMRLKEMEKNGLITKQLVLGAQVRTEYSLTDKAEQLTNAISSLKKWASSN